jgi:hypothetical protein
MAIRAGAVALWLALGASTTSPTSGGSTALPAAVRSGPVWGPSPATPSALTINITIANRKVDPNWEEIDASLGQR